MSQVKLFFRSSWEAIVISALQKKNKSNLLQRTRIREGDTTLL